MNRNLLTTKLILGIIAGSLAVVFWLARLLSDDAKEKLDALAAYIRIHFVSFLLKHHDNIVNFLFFIIFISLAVGFHFYKKWKGVTSRKNSTIITTLTSATRLSDVCVFDPVLVSSESAEHKILAALDSMIDSFSDYFFQSTGHRCHVSCKLRVDIRTGKLQTFYRSSGSSFQADTFVRWDRAGTTKDARDDFVLIQDNTAFSAILKQEDAIRVPAGLVSRVIHFFYIQLFFKHQIDYFKCNYLGFLNSFNLYKNSRKDFMNLYLSTLVVPLLNKNAPVGSDLIDIWGFLCVDSKGARFTRDHVRALQAFANILTFTTSLDSKMQLSLRGTAQ